MRHFAPSRSLLALYHLPQDTPAHRFYIKREITPVCQSAGVLSFLNLFSCLFPALPGTGTACRDNDARGYAILTETCAGSGLILLSHVPGIRDEIGRAHV